MKTSFVFFRDAAFPHLILGFCLQVCLRKTKFVFGKNRKSALGSAICLFEDFGGLKFLKPKYPACGLRVGFQNFSPAFAAEGRVVATVIPIAAFILNYNVALNLTLKIQPGTGYRLARHFPIQVESSMLVLTCPRKPQNLRRPPPECIHCSRTGRAKARTCRNLCQNLPRMHAPLAHLRGPLQNAKARICQNMRQNLPRMYPPLAHWKNESENLPEPVPELAKNARTARAFAQRARNAKAGTCQNMRQNLPRMHAPLNVHLRLSSLAHANPYGET